MQEGPSTPPQVDVRPSSSVAENTHGHGKVLRRRSLTPFTSSAKTLLHHFKHHFGLGIVCAVAYFDPGNWSTDLQAGSEFGYELLTVVLLSGLGAVVLQVLSCKLGCVTGLDLASHCRLLLYNHPRYPRLVRFLFLYPLYVLSEVAIISTDIAELLGSAIGIVLLIPAIPLPVAVFLTAADCLVILFVGDPTKGHRRSLRIFELIIIALVSIVFVCFVVLLARVSPDWPAVFKGYIPSKTLVEPSALYISVGIIGATVMPHALFLGSHLATRDRLEMRLTRTNSNDSSLPAVAQQSLIVRRWTKKRIIALFLFQRTRQSRDEDERDTWTPYGERANNDLSFIRVHYRHGIWDIVVSLLGVAVVINSAILILAGAVFFFGSGKTMDGTSAGLFDAHDVLQTMVGKPAAVVYAIALICSGQSASITATLAGQIVSEGFIQWTVSPFLRRIITRLLGLVPAMAVALALGKAGIDTLLVISQIVLSIVLPFVLFPLIWLTSSSLVMRVEKPRAPRSRQAGENIEEKSLEAKSLPNSEDDGCVPSGSKPLQNSDRLVDSNSRSGNRASREDGVEDNAEPRGQVRSRDDGIDEFGKGDEPEYVDYSNSWPLIFLSYGIWLIILAANGYLIVTLAIAD